MSPHSVSILVKSAILFFFFFLPLNYFSQEKIAMDVSLALSGKRQETKQLDEKICRENVSKETLFCGEYFKTKTWTNLFSLSLVYFLGFWT